MLKEFTDSIILYLLLTLVTLLIGFGLAFLRAKLANEKDITLKSLARDAVLYAQETNGKFSGIIRWDVATEIIETQAKKKGIKLESEDVEVLLKSVLKELKVTAGERWKDASEYSAVDEEDDPDEPYPLVEAEMAQGGDPNL